jgi:hypothetical protein
MPRITPKIAKRDCEHAIPQGRIERQEAFS